MVVLACYTRACLCLLSFCFKLIMRLVSGPTFNAGYKCLAVTPILLLNWTFDFQVLDMSEASNVRCMRISFVPKIQTSLNY